MPFFVSNAHIQTKNLYDQKEIQYGDILTLALRKKTGREQTK